MVAKDAMLGTAAAATATCAYLGLSAWRNELKGKSEYELAKKVLKAVYRVRDAFKTVRNPIIFKYEYPENMQDSHGQLKHEYEYEGTLRVYAKRWEKMEVSFNELEELHLEAQVEWGAGLQNKIIALRQCKAELQLAIHYLLRQKKNPLEQPTKAAQLAEERSVLEHIDSDTELDIFTPQINAAIDEFENWLRPYVRAKV